MAVPPVVGKKKTTIFAQPVADGNQAVYSVPGRVLAEGDTAQSFTLMSSSIRRESMHNDRRSLPAQE
tara:strand:- start:845 stop:1045 length:201 start_codon:yes stop_codon:yes gene_type:complete